MAPKGQLSAGAVGLDPGAEPAKTTRQLIPAEADLFEKRRLPKTWLVVEAATIIGRKLEVPSARKVDEMWDFTSVPAFEADPTDGSIDDGAEDRAAAAAADEDEVRHLPVHAGLVFHVNDSATYNHGRGGHPGRGVKFSLRLNGSTLMQSNTLRRIHDFDSTLSWFSLVPRSKAQTHDDVFERHLRMLKTAEPLQPRFAKKQTRVVSADTVSVFERRFYEVPDAERVLWRADVAADFVRDLDFRSEQALKRKLPFSSSLAEHRSTKRLERPMSSPRKSKPRLNRMWAPGDLAWFSTMLKVPAEDKAGTWHAFSQQYFGYHPDEPVYGLYIPPAAGPYELYWCLFMGDKTALAMRLQPMSGDAGGSWSAHFASESASHAARRRGAPSLFDATA